MRLSGGDKVQNSQERLGRCREGQLVEDQTLAAGQAPGMDHTAYFLPPDNAAVHPKLTQQG